VQAQPPPERRSSKFARSMVIHAQAALITLGLAGWGFAAFAAIRLIGGVSSQTPEAAMNEARELVSRQTNHNIGDVQLETFEIQGAEYKISYRIVPEDFIYAVTISKNDGEIKAAAHRTSK